MIQTEIKVPFYAFILLNDALNPTNLCFWVFEILDHVLKLFTASHLK